MEDKVSDETATAITDNYVKSLSKLWDLKDEFFLTRDYDKVFRVLMCLYNRIEHKLDESEIKETEKLLRQIYPEIRKEIRKRRMGDLSINLDKLDRRLKRLAYKYEILST